MGRLQRERIRLGTGTRLMSTDLVPPPTTGFHERPAETRAADEASSRARELVTAAETEATVILENARQQAQQLLAEAEAQAKEQAIAIKDAAQAEGYQTGHTEGHDHGYQTGLAEVQALTAAQCETASILVDTACKTRTALFGRTSPVFAEILQRISQRLFGEALNLRVDLLAGMLARIHAQLQLEGEVTLVLSPARLQRLEADEAACALLADCPGLRFVTDPFLDEHQMLMQHETGWWDVSLESQLDEMIGAVLGVLPAAITDAPEPELPELPTLSTVTLPEDALADATKNTPVAPPQGGDVDIIAENDAAAVPAGAPPMWVASEASTKVDEAPVAREPFEAIDDDGGAMPDA